MGKGCLSCHACLHACLRNVHRNLLLFAQMHMLLLVHVDMWVHAVFLLRVCMGASPHLGHTCLSCMILHARWVQIGSRDICMPACHCMCMCKYTLNIPPPHVHALPLLPHGPTSPISSFPDHYHRRGTPSLQCDNKCCDKQGCSVCVRPGLRSCRSMV